MKRFLSKNLNIPKLLTLGDLDVRGIAAANGKLSAREYFMWVEWFIEDAPKYIEELSVAPTPPDKLEKISSALSEMGYNKLKTDIETIISDIQNEKTAQAKIRSIVLLNNFKAFYERLKSAYTSKKRRTAQITTEWFIEETALYIDSLSCTSDLNELLPELEKIKKILGRIGYHDLNSDIETIISDIQNGKTEKTESNINELSEKLKDYYERVKSAYFSINREYARLYKDKPSQTDDSASLQEALEYFDFEEAHRKLRILAVDDNAILLNSVTSVLSPYYEVFALPKASQVKKFLTHTSPELFLLDIEMPELNGYDLVSVIRSFEQHKDTPIIFLTGSATSENVKTAIAVGASDFITKPIVKDILLKKIENKIIWKKSF